MGKITSISALRRPGRYNVMVDGTFTIAVSEKVLVDLNLAVGREMDEQRLAETATAEESNKAFNHALLLLESRPRSENEIVTRLKRYSYNAATIKTVIDKLRGFGFIDDSQFTEAWIESRSRTQPGGKYKLKSELIQKGIAKETIDEALIGVTEEVEIELARKALAKRPAHNTKAPDDRRPAYIRDAGYLARRGFSWQIARPVLKERYGNSVSETDDETD